jgi:chromosome segregation ATPase
MQERKHMEAVNWSKEKEELRQELDGLLEEIRNRKSSVKATDSKLNARQSTFENILPLLKKWQGKATAEVPEDATIPGLIQQWKDAKVEHDERLKSEQDEVAQLISDNSKLEDKVGKKKAALDRSVDQFHALEAQMLKSIEEAKQQADSQEQKLQKQIAKAKLNIGQSRIQKV